MARLRACSMLRRCRADFAMQGVLQNPTKVPCGWRTVGTVQHCPRYKRFTKRLSTNGKEEDRE